MRVTCISDTHCHHEDVALEGGDVLVHAGDFTMRGSREEIESFAGWMQKQSYTHKIVIAGNHELSLDRDRFEERLAKFANKPAALENLKRTCSPDTFIALLENAGCIYLHDSSVTINGYTFYGTPFCPMMPHWAFMLRPDGRREKFALIPPDTDVLITHTPPHGILDGAGDTPETERKGRMGCAELREAVRRVKPLYHVFGHIHVGYGVAEEGGTAFVNAAVCDEDYAATNKPQSFSLPPRGGGEQAVEGPVV